MANYINYMPEFELLAPMSHIISYTTLLPEPLEGVFENIEEGFEAPTMGQLFPVSTGGPGGTSEAAPIASATESGTVKTNTTVADPVVYRDAEVDTLLTGKSDTSHTHANLPTDDEKDALAGTDGTPSASNPYVTDSDSRLTGGGSGGGGGLAIPSYYDPELNPTGQTAPTYELDFKTLTAFPSGWSAYTGGDFSSHDVNTTRPGGLWAKAPAGGSAWKGKTYAAMVAAGVDFCCLWRPWLVGNNTNFSLIGVDFIVGSSGVLGFHGRHASYGSGMSYAYERFGSSTASPASWNMDQASTPGPGFMRVRRVGTTVYYGYSPDGSTWQEVAVSSDSSIGTGAVDIAIIIYGSTSLDAEGGISVFRVWTADGTTKRSGKLVTGATAGNLGTNPDKIPDSPNAMDDEFESGTSIDLTKWTARLVTTITNSVTEGALKLAIPQDSLFVYQGYTQPVPVSGDKTFHTKLWHAGVDINYHTVGAVLERGTGASRKSLMLYAQYNSGVSGVQHLGCAKLSTDSDSFAGGYLGSVVPIQLKLQLRPYWLRYRIVSTTIYVEYSWNGRHWYEIGNESESTWLGGRAERVGLVILNGNPTNGTNYGYFEYFRAA